MKRSARFSTRRRRFATLEDLVIHKIIAGRPREIEDIEAILIKNRKYDTIYIEKWLAEFESAPEKDYGRIFAEIREKII